MFYLFSSKVIHELGDQWERGRLLMSLVWDADESSAGRAYLCRLVPEIVWENKEILGSSRVACSEAKWMSRDKGASGTAMSKGIICTV